MLRIKLLGGFQVERDGVAITAFHSQKARALLAYLMIYRDRMHPRSVLATLFWGESDEARAHANLRNALYALRQALEGPAGRLGQYLITEGSAVRFNDQSKYSLDVQEFEEKLKAAHKASSTERAALLEEAVGLYQGDLLPGFYDDWVVIEQEHLRELHLHALKELAAHYTAQKDYPHAIEWARRALAANPLQEDLYRALMQLYALVGNRTAALQQYAECAAVLKRELAVTPLPETRTFYEKLLQGVPVAAIPQEVAELPAVPFVGRAREHEMLQTLWKNVQHGQGQAILIGGEAGVGKTTFVQHFVEALRASPLQGTAYALGSELPYQPILQAVRQGLALTAPKTLTQLPALWRSELAQFVPELQEQFPDLKPNPQLPPPQGKARWFAALTGFFELLSRERPVMLFLDDLHWADDATLEYLSHLTAQLKNLKLLLIGTYRTEEALEGSRLRAWLDRLGPGRAYHPLTLPRLSPAETGSLVQQLVGAARELPLRLYHETEGNPLFLTELVRSLVHSGTLFQDHEGRWQLATEEIGVAHWPESLRELIGASLRRVPTRAQSLLGLVSVIGRTFELPVLREIMHQPEERLLDQLDELCKGGLIVEREGRYQFHHELVRQAVYEGLSTDRRKLWHRRVGQVFEALYPQRLDELSNDLAHHFEQARLWKKAIRYAERAGTHAQNGYAHTEAVKFFMKAAKLCQQIKDRQSLGQNLSNISKVYVGVGQYEEALRYQQQALEIYREIRDPQGQGRSWNNIGVVYQNQGKYEEALRCYHQALDICREAKLHQGEGILLNNIGNISYFFGRYEEALVYYQRALEVRRELRDRQGEGISLDNMGATCQSLGRYKEALRFHRQALEIRREIGDRWGEGDTLDNFGVLHLGIGKYDEAKTHLQHALQIRREIGDRRGQGYCLYNLGHALRGCGEPSEALKHYRAAQALFEELGMKAEHLMCLSAEGITQLDLNELEPALTCSSQAIQILAGGQTCATPQEIYFNHFKVLAAHKLDAHTYLQQAYDEVMRRAEKITEREMREGFLKNIPINRQILQAWQTAQQTKNS